MASSPVVRSPQEIEEWLVSQIADLIGVDEAEIGRDKTFVSFGISSLAAVTLSGDLDEWLSVSLPETLAWDYPTIALLAAHVAALTSPAQAPGPARTLGTAGAPIAIIGMACRFPGAPDLDAYWDLLSGGADHVSEVPADRWDIDALYDPSLEDPAKMSTRHGSFLPDVARFDAAFFGISQREADAMDPQQRHLLEVTWQSLEHAGIVPERLAGGPTGVFVAINGTDYYKLMRVAPSRAGTGVSNCIGPNRISYMLDLQGPSIAIDTACSSSLVAVHLACQSLRTGESQVAIAGAVNLTLLPDVTVALSQAAMMAPDGRCKTFDASANGYVRGEGCGALVLKRLDDAERDGDRVLAVIRGTAVNQDGRSNGLTAPNGLAQQRVIRQALDNGGIAPASVGYVETHGSGTPLGDPIEVQALAAVLAEGRAPDAPPCYLGAVKTNFGHLEVAAGMAGLIKAVLSLRYGAIPPNLHFNAINPRIALGDMPFKLPTALTPWPAVGRPRVAGVSSFGFGGTNAHVVLEEARPVAAAPAPVGRALHALTLSAKHDAALRGLATAWTTRLAHASPSEAGAMAHAARVQRTAFGKRLVVTGADAAALEAGLAAYLAGEPAKGLRVGEGGAPPRVAFMFAGQGTLSAGLARALYDRHPAFRAVITRCDAALVGLLDRPVSSLLFGGGAALERTQYAQPALFALEVALAALWREWGVVPTAVIGHSLGEFAAACVAGVYSIEDGIRLVAARGRLMQALPAGGAMAAVFAPEDEVAAAIADQAERLSVAAVNGARHTVISGDRTALEAALTALGDDHQVSAPFAVSHAFHSPLIAPMLEAFAAELARVQPLAPQIPLVSCLTGEVLMAAPDAGHWLRHAREAVRFDRGMATLAALGVDVCLELGPDATLGGMAKRLVPKEIPLLASLAPGGEEDTLVAAAAALWVRGAAIDWAALERETPWPRSEAPGYPFQGKRCWLPADEIAGPVAAEAYA